MIDFRLMNVGLKHCSEMFTWLINVYMSGVVREVTARVFGKVLELLHANGGRFEINQLLFTYDITPVAHEEVSMRINNCTNDVVWSRCRGYVKC